MMEVNLRFFRNKLVFKMHWMRLRKEWTTGTHNRTEDGMYALYLDYDKLCYDDIKGELKRLHDTYDIGPMHIFCSSRSGVHVISFSRFTAREYMRIVSDSSCDLAFRNIPLFSTSRKWVLRFDNKGKTKKPKYLKTLRFDSDRKASFAHWKFFNLHYPEAKIKQPKNSDGYQVIGVVEYATAKNC